VTSGIARVQVTARGILAECTAFFSWWLHELRELGEATLARVAPKLSQRVLVRFAGETAIAVIGTEEHPLDAVHSMRGARAVLMIDSSDALIHEVSLPAAVERELDHAIELYLERELPLPPQQLCTDWSIVRRDRDHHLIVVRILVVRREDVERMRNRIMACGLRPVRAAILGANAELIGDVLTRPRSHFALRSLDRRLAGIVVSLAAATAGVIAAQWTYERVQVGQEVERVRSIAQSAQALADRLARDAAAANALARIMRQSDAADVLKTLTTVVPSDSWVYALNVGPAPSGTLQIELDGFTPTATVLVDLLDKAPELEEVRLVSATSAGLGAGQDRLHVTARWAGK
jgi:hypothetical protein